MFGKKKRIIETQKALIADLREEIEHNEKIRSQQHQRIIQLVNELNTLITLINSNDIDFLRTVINATDIDFPNSEKGGSDHTGVVNVSDILNL